MIILFKATDKSLVITKQSRLLQGENVADIVTFYVPTVYESTNLSDTVVVFSYICSNVNIANMETLAQEESDKDGFLKYSFPVISKITKYAGEITGHLTFTDVNQANETYTVVQSRDITFSVEAFDDYYRFVTPDSLSAIDQKLLEIDNNISKLHTVADEINVDLPRDLSLDETGLLQLKTDTKTIGDGVNVVVNYDLDNTDDGITDLDNLDGDSPVDGDDTDDPSYIDLDG